MKNRLITQSWNILGKKKKSWNVVVKGLVAQIATLSIFNGGLKLKSIHYNYQIIQKKLKHVLVIKKRICLQGYNQSLLKKKTETQGYLRQASHSLDFACHRPPTTTVTLMYFVYPITFVIVVGKKINNLFYTL